MREHVSLPLSMEAQLLRRLAAEVRANIWVATVTCGPPSDPARPVLAAARRRGGRAALTLPARPGRA